jgi:drug/metabolite transporter (DMT)-like permease
MRTIQGYLLLSFSMVTVGSTVVAGKWMVDIGPFTANALRLAMAMPMFLLALRWSGEASPPLCRHDFCLVVAQALAGSVGYTTLLFLGVRLTDAASAGVIVGTLPVVALVLSVILFGERPGWRTWCAVLLAVGGVVWMTAGPDGGGSVRGKLLIGAAVLCEAIFVLLNRRLRAPLAPLVLSTLLVSIGLAASIIPAAVELIAEPSLPVAALLGAAYYAVIPTFLGFIAWYAGSARVSASEAAMLTAVAPLAAMVLSVMLLGEELGERQIVGAALVIGGVMLQVRPNGSSPKEISNE